MLRSQVKGQGHEAKAAERAVCLQCKWIGDGTATAAAGETKRLGCKQCRFIALECHCRILRRGVAWRVELTR